MAILLIIISHFMKLIKKIGLLAFGIFTLNASAQTDKTTTTRIVTEKKYIFVATTAVAMNSTEINNVMSKMAGGNTAGSISLNGSSYEVEVTPDSLNVYLPYFGRAYSAPMNSNEGGYKFKAKDFTYQITQRKKGGWEVSIATKDVKDNVRMNLSIGVNGYGTLSVMSNNKQPISYYGYLSEPKKDKI